MAGRAYAGAVRQRATPRDAGLHGVVADERRRVGVTGRRMAEDELAGEFDAQMIPLRRSRLRPPPETARPAFVGPVPCDPAPYAS